jgi:Raf kinase inhibitor-like YbhB/YbcL family protein
VLLVALASLLVLAVSACGSSGRALRDAEPDTTAPPRKPPAAGTLAPGSSTTLSTVFAITTDAWTPGAEIPAVYTCDGEDISPPFVLSQIPPGTAELALVVNDVDANGIVHWLVAGITADTTLVPEGAAPAGAVEALSANGEAGWFGPCPPEDEVHNYEFNLYALSAPSGITAGQSAEEAMATIDATTIARSQFTGTYQR